MGYTTSRGRLSIQARRMGGCAAPRTRALFLRLVRYNKRCPRAEVSRGRKQKRVEAIPCIQRPPITSKVMVRPRAFNARHKLITENLYLLWGFVIEPRPVRVRLFSLSLSLSPLPLFLPLAHSRCRKSEKERWIAPHAKSSVH